MGDCPWPGTHSLQRGGAIYTCVLGMHAFKFFWFRTWHATSQRRWWLRLNAASGAARSTSGASRCACCWSLWKNVAPLFLFTVRMASYFDGLPSMRTVGLFFFVFARFFWLYRCRRWPPRIGSRARNGTECRTMWPLAIPGGGTTAKQVAVRCPVFLSLAGLYRFLGFGFFFFLQDLAAAPENRRWIGRCRPGV